MAKGKYDGTLNLPQTKFPMRANLPNKEPETIKFWDEIDVYRKVQAKNAGKEKFILHDGPPYANGNIHLGHTLNKVLKDIIVKYRSMSGFDSPYVPGWDTHGLPIEQQAIKAMGIDRHKTDVINFRKHCKEYALKFVGLQRDQFKRLGIRGDWQNPYLTLKPEFESVQIKVFGEMANKGYIYKGLKPVYWCADCETALAEAEIEYHDKTSHSIYVKFPVKDGKGILPEDVNIVIWTTTPWTLPANAGVCLNPEYDYIVVKTAGEKYLIAKDMLTAVAEKTGWENYEIQATFKGRDLERVVCRHPFVDRDSLVILGEHVTLEAGTGCVHTAPGHGEDDFFVGKEYDLPVISPVNNQGIFTSEAGKFAGLFVQDANKPIIEELKSLNMLLNASNYQHQYPYCWRCKNPIIYRATEQWFASIDGFRQRALEAIDQVEWIPAWGRDRIYNMVRDRGDWCISRQRTWGVPIPIIYCESCGETIINEATIDKISQLFSEFGSDIWFIKEAGELLPEGFKCPHCGQDKFRKETDIMDVWFDSGSSHLAVLGQNPELQWPADLYLEGSDQHRGWFNSSLSTAVAVKGTAPYKKVLTHGFIVDEKGYKMSKSSGNGIDPLAMTSELGADILRLWVSSADYRTDIAVSDNIIRQSSEAYRKIRNTCRFIIGNIYDFDNQKDAVAYEQLSEMDKWALLRLNKLIERVTKAYNEYEFHVVFHAVHNFCTVDLSNIYFDISKDKLYCLLKDDPERRAVQTVLNNIIEALVILITPILTFTSEEIWSYIKKENDPESVQLLDWPAVNPAVLDNQLEEKVNKLLAVREVTSKAMEEARSQKIIGHTLGAWIKIYADSNWLKLLQNIEQLDKFFIAARVDLAPEAEKTPESIAMPDVPGIWVEVKPAPGEKCERCWVIDSTVGENSDHTGLCHRCAEVIEKMEA